MQGREQIVFGEACDVRHVCSLFVFLSRGPGQTVLLYMAGRLGVPHPNNKGPYRAEKHDTLY